MAASFKVTELEWQSLVDEKVGAVHHMKVQVRSRRIAAIADSSQKGASPNQFSLVNLQTGLLQMSVVAKLPICVADRDGVTQQAPHIAAHDSLIRDCAGRHIRHIETDVGHFPPCRGIDRLMPTVMVGKCAAVALMCTPLWSQLHEIHCKRLAVDLRFVEVAPIARLHCPPGPRQRKVEVGLLLMIGYG